MERNTKVNYGKDEVLSDTEIDLRDEEIEEEKEKNKFVQIVNQSTIVCFEISPLFFKKFHF